MNIDLLAFWKWLSGKKTYLLGIVGIIYAIAGFITGNMDFQAASQFIFASLGGMTIRNGMQTNANKTNDKVDEVISNQ